MEKKETKITMTTQLKESGLCGESSWLLGFDFYYILQPKMANEHDKIIMTPMLNISTVIWSLIEKMITGQHVILT